MKLIDRISFIIFLFLVVQTTSCKKQDTFLSAKPDQSLAVPTSLAELQSLLNNEELFNSYCDPPLGLWSSDEFWLPTTEWQGLYTTMEQNAYIWAKNIYEGNTYPELDWNQPYKQVYYANTVLDAIDKINFLPEQTEEYNKVKGTALFVRSYAFYNLLQIFSMPYDSITSKTDLGIPLRLSSDLNIKLPRATVQDCYDQLTSDLKKAADLLPVTATYKTQPSKVAANAMLARVYIAIGKYQEAYLYANNCLQLYDTLVDYNTLTPETSRISDDYLGEDIYHTTLIEYSGNLSGSADSTVYNSYQDNDLRKTCFFRIRPSGEIRFRGTYDFQTYLFDGLATDEVYLIRAECNARNGNIANAMVDLNTLLEKRWITGTFVPFTALNEEDALQKILLERRKELVYRGLRWTDLRRLNKDDRFKVTLTRIIDGVTYSLEPNNKRYALSIPDAEIILGGIPQNDR